MVHTINQSLLASLIHGPRVLATRLEGAAQRSGRRLGILGGSAHIPAQMVCGALQQGLLYQ